MPSPHISNWLHTRLFDEVPVAICVIDRDFHIVKANRRFHDTYGDWEGRPCYSVYKDRSSICERCGAAATFAGITMTRPGP